jgi:hypothetical protein
MAAAMRAQAHPAAAEELAALVVEASGRRTREEFLADVAAAATPVDREATGWFESAGAPPGGPSVQRRVDRRTKRMEAYPPVDRSARPASAPAGSGPADAKDEPPPAEGEASSNGRPARRQHADPAPPTDRDAEP